MFNRSHTALVVVVASFTLGGCAAQTGGDEGDEAVGAAADALITDSQAPNVYRTLGAPGTSVGAEGAPIGNEYQNDFVPGYWVVEIDGTTSRALTPVITYAGLAGDALNASNCGAAHLASQVYGYLPPFYSPITHQVSPAHWDNLGALGAAGVPNFAKNQCLLSLPAQHIPASAYSIIRIAGQATLKGVLKNVNVYAHAD